ncbi:MAG: hypothetical protein HAW63_01570 [Bdellovibrionaceae bacterium]|nr:hypothetical protein [Pseudobdellovibrionaceae bacterium]
MKGFNKKWILCFLSVFVVTEFVAARGIGDDSIKLVLNSTSDAEALVKKSCEERQETRAKKFRTVCRLYGKSIGQKKSDAKECEEQIKKCEAIKNFSLNDGEIESLFKGKEKSEIEDLQKWKKNLDELQAEEEPDNSENKTEITELEAKIHKNGISKYCPLAEAYIDHQYQKEKESNKDEVSEKRKKIEKIKDSIEELKTKKNVAMSNRDDEIFQLKEDGAKNDRKYLKSIKNLEKTTKDKITKLLESVEQNRKTVQGIDLAIQELLVEENDVALKREEQCYKQSTLALKKYREDRVERVLNGTNHVSFSTLLKRAKTSQKTRDRRYRQKKQAQCLNAPSKQKRLAFEHKRFLTKKKALRKAQEAEIKKMKEASASQAKIDHEEHIERGELIEANTKVMAALSEQVGLKAKEFERKIQNFDEKIKNKQGLLNTTIDELGELEHSDLAKQAALISSKKKRDYKKIKAIETYTTAAETLTEFNEEGTIDCASAASQAGEARR